MYRDGIGVTQDRAEAARIFDEACHRPVGDDDLADAPQHKARACSLLGSLYLDGSGVPRDQLKGRQLSELGCSSGDGFGCFNSALAYRHGMGVPVDLARAASFFEQGCTAGDGESCHELAQSYEKGDGVPSDVFRAADLEKKACELGFSDACAQ
jgi:TPR repeat protein